MTKARKIAVANVVSSGLTLALIVAWVVADIVAPPTERETSLGDYLLAAMILTNTVTTYMWGWLNGHESADKTFRSDAYAEGWRDACNDAIEGDY